MDKFPIIATDGIKLALEDLEAGWSVAGSAGDKVRAMLAQVPIESGDRKGYVVAAQDGPIVISNGSTGTVKVQPFTGYRSPQGSETTLDLLTGFYIGSTESVPTPLPASGNHRWDLLYAIISDTDSDAETRQVEDPVTGDLANATVNTRHKSVVTLAWVKGSESAQATTTYPAGNWPALPTPLAGQAHVPLAYVHVFDDATPATVTYDRKRVFNMPQKPRFNPAAGALSVGGGGLARIGGTAGYAEVDDLKSIVTGATVIPTVVGGDRPSYFIETPRDEIRLTLPWNFRNSAVIGTSWIVFPTQIVPLGLIDWKNRWFEGRFYVSEAVGSLEWAHDGTVSSSARVWPSTMPVTVASKQPRFGLGNTIAPCVPFETESGLSAGDWYVACMIRDVLGAGANSDLAVLVRRSATSGSFVQGGMYFAAREATSGDLDNRVGIVKLDITGPMFPLGF